MEIRTMTLLPCLDGSPKPATTITGSLPTWTGLKWKETEVLGGKIAAAVMLTHPGNQQRVVMFMIEKATLEVDVACCGEPAEILGFGMKIVTQAGEATVRHGNRNDPTQTTRIDDRTGALRIKPDEILVSVSAQWWIGSINFTMMPPRNIMTLLPD